MSTVHGKYLLTKELVKPDLNFNDNLISVDALDRETRIQVLPCQDGGIYAVFIKKEYTGRDEWGDYEYDEYYITAKCKNSEQFLDFLSDARITLPKGFLESIDNLEFSGCTSYAPTLEDITGLDGEPFKAYWSLSYESADDESNESTFESLTEAYEHIGMEGALASTPGNSASIYVGNIKVFDTHVKCDGIDMGDSPINPTSVHKKNNLFDQILAHEKSLSESYDAESKKNQTPSIASLKALVYKSHYQLAFHGTGQKIEKFTMDGMGKGGDHNSAMGVFMTEIVDSAVEYALMSAERGEGDKARIYVLAFPTIKTYSFDSSEDFFGLEENSPAKTHEEFARFREDLIRQGYDSATYETGDDVIVVSLHPDKVIIVAELEPHQMSTMKSYEFRYEHILHNAMSMSRPKAEPSKEQIALGYDFG